MLFQKWESINVEGDLDIFIFWKGTLIPLFPELHISKSPSNVGGEAHILQYIQIFRKVNKSGLAEDSGTGGGQEARRVEVGGWVQLAFMKWVFSELLAKIFDALLLCNFTTCILSKKKTLLLVYQSLFFIFHYCSKV